MSKEKLKEYLSENCSDFLNFGEGSEIHGEMHYGLYIEIEDAVDLILQMKKEKVI